MARVVLDRGLGARLRRAGDPWAICKEFVQGWHGPIQRRHASAPREMQRAEERLGVPLPAALRRWYGLLGAHPLATGHNRLLPPRRLAFEDEVLVLVVEEQSVVRWGVRRRDMDRADPSVWIVSRWLSPLGLSGWRWPAEGTLFLGGPDLVAIAYGDVIQLAGRTRTALDAVLDELAPFLVDWSANR